MSQHPSRFSAEARVLVRPATEYPALPQDGTGAGLMLRRPVALAFVLGCVASVLASGRFTARLITDGTLSYAFIPAIELAAFAVVYRTGARRRIPFARAVDLFFIGNAPWLLWLVILAGVASIVPPRQLAPWLSLLFMGFLIPAAWSAYVDFHFFRAVMNRNVPGAVRDLMLHRVIGWSGFAVYFVAGSLWSQVLPRIARSIGL